MMHSGREVKKCKILGRYVVVIKATVFIQCFTYCAETADEPHWPVWAKPVHHDSASNEIVTPKIINHQ